MFGELFFYIIGLYAFLWWFIDNFKSLFQILWNLLMSYFEPDKYPGLIEQFGNWAGELKSSEIIENREISLDICVLYLFSILLLQKNYTGKSDIFTSPFF